MFTGIVEAIGEVITCTEAAHGKSFTISYPKEWQDIFVGDSIAVQGVCLTVTEKSAQSLYFDVITETLQRSNLNNLHEGSFVNLERSMSPQGRFGGHVVQGHVDVCAKILAVQNDVNDYRLRVELPSQFSNLIVEKGYITIDGVSLTIAALDDTSFTIALIPHTLIHTVIGRYQIDSYVNLEFDVLGKYALRALQNYLPRTRV